MARTRGGSVSGRGRTPRNTRSQNGETHPTRPRTPGGNQQQEAFIMNTLQMITRLVHGLAQNASSGGTSTDTNGTTNGEARGTTHQQFMSLHPPKFHGKGTADDAKKWIMETEEIFTTLEVPYNKKVRCYFFFWLYQLGCGHGLPGIYACLKGAAAVHFQDFNVEVLHCLTVSNVKANLQKHLPETANDMCMPEVRFFAGDWTEVYQLFGCGNESNLVSDPDFGYDIILMAETVYSLSSLQSLYELVKKSLRRPNGIVYLAAKKYYFGVGGGTRDFRSIVENDGILESFLVAEFADGASNMRELWKFSFK
ncbi:Histidine methyltransferase 1-like protein [Nymphaea thermarum]|nr:Histidine methyltransferase 1-like protein [Nymphaea thermarum]